MVTPRAGESCASGQDRPATSSSSTSRPLTSASWPFADNVSSGVGNLQTSRVRQTPGQLLNRLGYFSHYKKGVVGSEAGRLIGSFGYTSGENTPLLPSTPPRARDPQLTSAVRRSISQHDIQYLDQNAKKNEEIFQEWCKAKDAQLHHKRERAKRHKQEELQRYIDAEMRIQLESNQKFAEWSIRKSLQAEVEAIRNVHTRQQQRIYSLQGRIRDAEARRIYKTRERSFNLRLSPANVPRNVEMALPRLLTEHPATPLVNA